MPTTIARNLLLPLLLGLSGLASAGPTAVDLFTAAGVPGTGGAATVTGPCYCQEPALFSPIVPLSPGTYDFGHVRDYWVQSGPTPDAGPDQPNLYLLIAPVELSGNFPADFPPQPSFVDPAATALCEQADDACNAFYRSAYADFDLVFTLPAGQNAVQLGLVGNDQYTPPVPEPVPSAMAVAGLLLVAGASMARRRSA